MDTLWPRAVQFPFVRPEQRNLSRSFLEFIALPRNICSKPHRHLSRNNRQQIYHAVKTAGITKRLTDAIKPQEVLNGKSNGEAPFHCHQDRAVLLADSSDAFQHNHQYAEENCENKADIKSFSGRSFSFKDNFMESCLHGASNRFVLTIVHVVVPLFALVAGATGFLIVQRPASDISPRHLCTALPLQTMPTAPI